MCLLKCHTLKKNHKKKTTSVCIVQSSRGVTAVLSDCCVVWDLSWISSSDRRGVGLRKGKGDDGVWAGTGAGWMGGGVVKVIVL